MKKLALNIEELTVDTFSTGSDGTGPQRGTVRARESSGMSDSLYNYSCDTECSCWIETVLYDTEWHSCGGSCGTCGGTDCHA